MAPLNFSHPILSLNLSIPGLHSFPSAYLSYIILPSILNIHSLGSLGSFFSFLILSLPYCYIVLPPPLMTQFSLLAMYNLPFAPCSELFQMPMAGVSLIYTTKRSLQSNLGIVISFTLIEELRSNSQVVENQTKALITRLAKLQQKFMSKAWTVSAIKVQAGIVLLKNGIL